MATVVISAGWTPDTIIALIVGIAVLVGAVSTAIVQLVTLKREQKKQSEQLEVVHKLVNSRLTAVLERVTQLTDALVNADVEVPNSPDE